MKRGLFVLFIFVGFLLQSCDIGSTELIGHAKVIVVDQAQNPVPGAVVTLTKPTNITVSTGTTNATGYFIYDHLYPTEEIYHVDCYTADSLFRGEGIIRVKPDTTIELVIPLYEL